MSLVIAKKFGNDIFFISDTKITDVNNEKLNTSLEDHLLKIVIINSQLVFGFAGSINDAEVALKKIDKNQTIEEIKSILYNIHFQSYRNDHYSVEFILGVGEPNFELIEFKNGKQMTVSSSWLGSSPGFSAFQKLMHSQDNDKTTYSQKDTEHNSSDSFGIKMTMNFYPTLLPLNDEKTNQIYSDNYSKALSAMRSIISSNHFNEIGGFYLPIAYRNGEFTYMVYSDIFSAEQQMRLSNEPTTISFGSPQNGSYIVSLMSEKDKYDNHYALFHFFHGNLGLIYERKENGLPRPLILSNCDSIDFSFILKNRFSLKEPPIISIGFSLDNFGINSEKYSKIGENETALERLSWGIIKCRKDNDLWKLYRSRAIINFKIKKYASTINDINEIISIVPQTEYQLLYSYKADSFFNIKKYDLAINNYDELIKINLNNPINYFKRGICNYHIALEKRMKKNLILAKQDIDEAENLGYDNTQIIYWKAHINNLNQILKN